MGTAAATKELYVKGDLSSRKLRALVEQHNEGVLNDRAIAAKLDADDTVDTTTYEAGLTALEIEIPGYTPDGDAVAGVLDPDYLPEELFRVLVAQYNARVTDIRGVVTKLNADSAVVDEDYASSAGKITALGSTGETIDFTPETGAGGSGALAQELRDSMATLTQDWHDLTAKLDADAGVADEDYEDEITALVLTEV